MEPQTTIPQPATPASPRPVASDPANPPAAPARPDPGPAMATSMRWLLVAYNLLALVLPTLALLDLYPNQSVFSGDAGVLFLCTLLGFAMGSVHGLASIAAHASDRTLGASYSAFYLVRPFLGGGIALITCLILLSGIGGFSVPDAASDPKKRELVLLAWAALAGLYSQPALDKLKELFQTVFSTNGANGKDGKKAGKDAADGKGAAAS